MLPRGGGAADGDEDEGYRGGDERRGSAASEEAGVETPFVVPAPADDGLASETDDDEEGEEAGARGLGQDDADADVDVDADPDAEFTALPPPPPRHPQTPGSTSGPPSRRSQSFKLRRNSLPRATSVATRGVIDLRQETVEDLVEDLELYAEEFAMWRVNSATSKARLQLARRGLVEAAAAVRHNHPDLWSGEVVDRFNKALTTAHRTAEGEDVVLEDSIFTVALEDRDADSLRTTFLRKTFFRHEINLRECTRVAAGWVCLFFVCYAPWFAVITLEYRTETECSDGESNYLFDFMFFLAVNFFLNCGAACVAGYDRGVICVDRDHTRRWLNRIIGLFTLMFVAYNVYGLTILWVPSGRKTSCSLRHLTLAVIIAFLALPCLCFILQTIFQVGDTRRRRKPPSHAQNV